MFPEPPLAYLDEFKEFALEHGQEVKRIFDWGGEHEWEGETYYLEPAWRIHLVKEQKIGEKIYMHMLDIRDDDVLRAWEPQWESFIRLNEMGLERVLKEHGIERI